MMMLIQLQGRGIISDFDFLLAFSVFIKLKQIKSIVNINPKLNMWYQTTPPLKDEREEKLIHTPTKHLPINS